MRGFDKNIEYFRKVVASRLDGEAAEAVLDETRREYEALLPEIPYIGGDRNRLTRDLINSTAGLALCKVLKGRGCATEEIAVYLHEVMEEQFGSYSIIKRSLIRSLGYLLYSFPLNRIYRRIIKEMAERSQRGEYDNNLVLYFVEGDSEEFDFGIDYTVCPICNLWRGQGMGDVMPYVCLWDFYSSELTGSGLVRTTTLSEGFDRCDFRFKRGRKPENRQKTRFPDV